MQNMVHHTVAPVLEVLGDESMGANIRIDESERMNKEPDCSLDEVIYYLMEQKRVEKKLLEKKRAVKLRNLLLEEANAYRIEEKKIEKTLLEKNEVMKEMERSLVNLERTVNGVQTEKSLFRKKKKMSFLVRHRLLRAAVEIPTSF